MNYHSAVKAHEGIVYLFLVLFIVKALLFFTNKTDLFQTVRAKTKVLEMILGTLLLASGVYLVVLRETVEWWVITKVVILLSAIPLTIIGFNKNNKTLVAVATLAFIGLFLFMKFKLHLG